MLKRKCIQLKTFMLQQDASLHGLTLCICPDVLVLRVWSLRLLTRHIRCSHAVRASQLFHGSSHDTNEQVHHCKNQ